jgi:glycosyltransferase involved in cell wall biosynthesis
MAEILHVTTVHPPLDTRIFYKQVRSLQAAGYAVELATTVPRAEHREGVSLLPLGSFTGPRWLRLMRDARALALMLARPQAVIHIHDPELLVVAFVPALLGRRLIYDVHEFYAERFAQTHWIPARLRAAVACLYDLVERVVLPHFCGVVIVADTMRAHYAALVGDEHVALVRNFPSIRPEDIEAARRAPHPLGGRPYILHTGGTSIWRAFDDMVAAAEQLRRRGCDLPIVSVGITDFSGFDSQHLAQLRARAERADVRIMDFVPYREALTYLAHASVGYLPLCESENYRRALPTKLFEYFLFGLPIVAADIGRTTEIIATTGAGVVVPIGDGSAHGDALYAIATDDELRARLRDASYRAHYSFVFAAEFERLTALYGRIVAEAAA